MMILELIHASKAAKIMKQMPVRYSTGETPAEKK